MREEALLFSNGKTNYLEIHEVHQIHGSQVLLAVAQQSRIVLLTIERSMEDGIGREMCSSDIIRYLYITEQR